MLNTAARQIRDKEKKDNRPFELQTEHAALILTVLVLNKVIDNGGSEKQQPWDT